VSILEERAALHRSLAATLTGEHAAEHLVRADHDADGADAIRRTIALAAKQEDATPGLD
jgi:hypothetical protein